MLWNWLVRKREIIVNAKESIILYLHHNSNSPQTFRGKVNKQKISFINNLSQSLRPHLVKHFKHIFSIFKQHYTYFHIFFHSHIFKKNINNITQTLLLNGLKFLLFTWIFFYFLNVSPKIPSYKLIVLDGSQPKLGCTKPFTVFFDFPLINNIESRMVIGMWCESETRLLMYGFIVVVGSPYLRFWLQHSMQTLSRCACACACLVF